MQTRLFARVLLGALRRLAPPLARDGWQRRWLSELENRQLLAERGELLDETVAGVCRRALADAWSQRFGDISVAQTLRSPLFVPAAFAAALLLLAGLSRGFAVTRGVFAVIRDLRLHPHFSGLYDPRGDHVFIYAAPVAMAAGAGLVLLAIGCSSLRGKGWRYWSFLAFKAIAVFVLVPLIWIELGTSVRSWIHPEGWRMAAGTAMVVAFVVWMGRAVIWTVADQRRRCPACLRRLIAPVAVGSWASLFEPAATEMLCEGGHGALALAEAEANAEDRWIELDESWRALFR